MKKKVIATTILSAAILGSLTGCGGVKTTDDSVVSTGAAEAATEANKGHRKSGRGRNSCYLLAQLKRFCGRGAGDCHF